MPKISCIKTQSLLGFQLKMSHQAKGPNHEQVFVAQIAATRSCWTEFPMWQVAKRFNSRVCGAARRKVRAEILATMDMLVQLQEIGIHPRNLPTTFKPFESNKPRIVLRKSCAQPKCSWNFAMSPYQSLKRKRGDIIHRIPKSPCLSITSPLSASASGGSKAEAEGKAIIAAAGAPLQAAVGTKLVKEYESLFQQSPGGHVAALVC